MKQEARATTPLLPGSAGGSPALAPSVLTKRLAVKASPLVKTTAGGTPALLVMRRLALAVVLGALLSAGGRAQSVSEYQMKAAYVYNLSKFVEWPPDAFKTASDPITICVLGQSPILQTLNEAVNGETIEDRKLIVRQVSDVSQARNCQLLFVGSSDRKYLQSALRELKAAGILTVGETASFTAEGGVVNFRLEGNKVRIEINLDAAERQRLRINPKLLSLAQIVKR